MPNKTIYVAEKDLEIFDQAQKVAGGNLSAAIVHALQEYVRVGLGPDREMKLQLVQVGRLGKCQQKRFRGTFIARWQVRVDDGRWEACSVYRTARDRYAVHSCLYVSSARLPEDALEVDLDIDLGFERVKELQIYNDLDEASARIPDYLLKQIRANGSVPEVEELDI